ncbi:MAG: NADH-ubiquinone oxidoreductase subunit E family protein [Arcobacteraceae bacterium]|jgi:NADH-quinone oxidoreductase subunit E|nr:NADH-ubiquinone oxidoreductase subunit E family protein [Arcobacteraceae bacterium]
MKRYDLRNHGVDFIPRLVELMNNEISQDENGIFLFEIGDFSAVQNVADAVKENNWTLMNSLKFNEVDWTVVIKKTQDESTVVENTTETEEE